MKWFRLWWLTAALGFAPQSVEYTVTVREPETRRVDVAAVILAHGAGQIDLELPEKFAFTGLPEPLLVGPVEQMDKDGTWAPIERVGPFRWRLDVGDDPVRLRWSVDHAFREQAAVLSARDAFEFPYVATDHAMLAGGAMLIAPVGSPTGSPPGSPPGKADRGERYSVRFALPEGWGVLAPWPSSEDVFHPEDRRALQDNLIAVGAWDTVSIRAEGAEVTLAFSPGQERAREQIARQVGVVLKTAMISFDHKPFDRYLVLFGRADQPGFGGSPKATSMTMSVDPDMLGPGSAAEVAHLIAHEFHHTWAVSRYDAPQELRFFSEGFTDYYAYLLPQRIGIATPASVAGAVALALGSWENNPAAAEHSLVSAGGPAFFDNQDTRDLIYKGGLVIAALVDARMREEGQGDLDGFMRALNNDPRWSRGGAAPDLHEFAELLEKHIPPEVAGQVLGWIRTPGFPEARFLLGAFQDAGVEVTRREGPASLDLRANFEGTTLTSIDPGDVAFRLGLREGDRLVLVNGEVVEDPRSIDAAWRSPIDGRIHVRYERGRDERAIDVPIPREATYEVSPSRWE